MDPKIKHRLGDSEKGRPEGVGPGEEGVRPGQDGERALAGPGVTHVEGAEPEKQGAPEVPRGACGGL